MVNVLRLIIWLLSQVTKFISPPPNFRNKIYKKIVIFPITTKAISNECKTQKKEAWKNPNLFLLYHRDITPPSGKCALRR